MNAASEVGPFSVMKQTSKRYNNLFKAQVTLPPKNILLNFG